MEEKVIQLISDWINGKSHFEFKTSGSTGLPKSIEISRYLIEYSAKQTMHAIDPNGEIKNCVLCINPNFIGGAMVVFRALVMGLDLKVIPVKANLESELQSTTDLISIVPLQFQETSQAALSKCKNILIGGGPMPVINHWLVNNVYATYGMTETVSNFALRPLEKDFFSVIGDAIISQTDEDCLQLKGTITNHKWLITNDIVDIIDSKRFRWKGRKDFVINSGGMKLSPEIIEDKLKNVIDVPFLISALPDDRLGEKMVLVIQSKDPIDISFDHLGTYEKPKEILYMNEFVYSSNGKINRIKTKENLLK